MENSKNRDMSELNLKDIAENNNTLIEYVLYELDIQFSELNGAADEFYAEWGNDSQAEQNKEKQKEILLLIKNLYNFDLPSRVHYGAKKIVY